MPIIVWYKTAKNKRVHVELCLIKLAYLPQLIVPEQSQPKKKTSGTTIHAFTRFDVHPTKYSFTYVVYLCLVS